MNTTSPSQTVIVGSKHDFVVLHPENACSWAPELGEIFWGEVESTLRRSIQGDTFPARISIQIPGEARRVLTLGVTPLPSEGDWRWRCALTDVSADVAEMDTLISERERFAGLVELSSEGFTIFDSQARIIFESTTNYLVHGYRAEEMLGHSLFEFTHPDDQERLLPRFQALAQNPGQRDSDIVRFRHKLGHWIYLDGTVINQLHDPRVGGMINNFRDITERLKMEDALREAKQRAEDASRLQRHFLTNLSHELRTPLTLIKQPVVDLAEQATPEQRQDPRWDIVERNIKRLECLLSELIDLSQFEAGQISLQMQANDLRESVEGWVAELRGAAEAKGLSFVIRGETQTPLFYDRHQLSKAGLNLLNNAIKFSPSGNIIEVVIQSAAGSDESTSPMLELRVNDAGRGLSKEDLERVFERFYQADASDTREAEGMGIGLAIAREVVQAHGGEIGVEPRVNGGSSFWFRLPQGAAHISVNEIEIPREEAGLKRFIPVDTEKTASHGEEGSAYTLLLVEDNRDMRYFLRMHLEAHYRVIEKVDGHSALHWLERHRPDIIVADVMMPKMDGVSLCREVRRRFDRQSLPILLLSAKRGSFDRSAGLEAGANDYMGKPFEVRELLLRLDSLRRTRPVIDAAPDGTEDWPRQVEQVMEAHLGDEAFSIGTMAKALGTSERQLHRLCHRYFEASPSACLRRFRLEQAREMLEQGRFPNVSLTAQAVGLSPHYFTRLFKNHFGRRPREVLATGSLEQ